MPTGNLPAEAKKLWEKVYDSSKAAGDSEERAAKKAWGAVKNAGWHKNEKGTWVKNSAIAEMSMAIVKAAISQHDGAMRLNLVNSDTGEDIFGEKMSLDLFQDFVHRSENDISVPEPFKGLIEESEMGYWSGGPPYLSISHYKSGGGANVPGKQECLYIDGEKLKSKDVLFDSPLGRTIWKSVHNDLYEEKKEYPDSPIRISIGFLDFKHEHRVEDGENFLFVRESLEDRCPLCDDGVGNKVYLSGHLVHKAFTRVPAHPRTLVEIDMVEKSDDIATKEEDAESIIHELAETLVGKSSIPDDILVVKAKDEDGCDQTDDEDEEEDDEERVTEKASKREDVSPADKKRAEKKYGDVTYADEKNKKYPIDTEEHIRAAWNYIHQKRNAAKYSAAEVAAIKRKIISAWKRVIGGTPPSAEEKSEAIIMEEQPIVEEEVKEPEPEAPVEESEAVPEKSQVELAVENFMTKFAEVKKNNLHGEDAAKVLQPYMNALAEETKKEINPASPLDGLAEVVKAAVAEAIATLKPELVAEVLKAMPTQPATKSPEIPQARGLSKLFLTRSLQTQEKSRIQELAERSTFGGQPH